MISRLITDNFGHSMTHFVAVFQRVSHERKPSLARSTLEALCCVFPSNMPPQGHSRGELHEADLALVLHQLGGGSESKSRRVYAGAEGSGGGVFN